MEYTEGKTRHLCDMYTYLTDENPDFFSCRSFDSFSVCACALYLEL